MPANCIVLDLFFPSTGTVAFLDFPQGIKPYVGMRLANTMGYTWEVIKYGRPILISEEIKYKSNYGSEAIWDCTLKAVSHSEPLKISDQLVVQ